MLIETPASRTELRSAQHLRRGAASLAVVSFHVPHSAQITSHQGLRSTTTCFSSALHCFREPHRAT